MIFFLNLRFEYVLNATRPEIVLPACQRTTEQYCLGFFEFSLLNIIFCRQRIPGLVGLIFFIVTNDI